MPTRTTTGTPRIQPKKYLPIPFSRKCFGELTVDGRPLQAAGASPVVVSDRRPSRSAGYSARHRCAPVRRLVPTASRAVSFRRCVLGPRTLTLTTCPAGAHHGKYLSGWILG